MTASCNTITISIHALRKESDMRLHQRQHDAIISIHALRKESDNDGIGGAFASPISIHALRKESDSLIPRQGRLPWLFQSTLSVRRATSRHFPLTFIRQFQSTLSVRRATSHRFCLTPIARISIHALRKESDSSGSIGEPSS